MASDFDCVYLDTNVLFANGWPRESNEMHVFLFLAKMLGVAVFIPLGVEIERRRQWEVAMQESVKTLQSRWNKLFYSVQEFAELNILVGRPAPITVPTLAQLALTYDTLADRLKQRWNIRTIPLASRESAFLFELAVHRKAAFKKDGEGFQDTLIYLSVIDHLQSIARQRGAFVSDDGAFRSTPARDLSREMHLDIEVFTDLPSVIERMKTRLADSPKKLWELDIHAAEQSLWKHLPVLQKFVVDEFSPHVSQLFEPSDPGFVRDVEIIGITNVQTPSPSEREEDKDVRVSFDLSVRIRVALPFSGLGEKRKLVDVDIKAEAGACLKGDYYDEVKNVRQLSGQITGIADELSVPSSVFCSVGSTYAIARGEGYSELLGEIHLQLSGTVPSHLAAVHVDVVVSLDTFLSGRLDSSGYLDAILRLGRRGLVIKGKPRNTNAIVFESIPLGVGGTRLEEVWTITGLRGDASAKGVIQASSASSITASVEMITADLLEPRTSIAREIAQVALVQVGVVPHVEKVVTAPTPTALSDGKEERVYSFVVRFEPQFPGALKTERQEAGDGVSPADCGTVCVVNLSNIPTNFRVFATLHEIEHRADPWLATAVETNAAGVPKKDPVKIAAIDWAGEPMVEVQRRAAWEIVDTEHRISKTDIRFGFRLIGPTGHAPFVAQAQACIAPTFDASLQIRTANSELPLPRFQRLNPPVSVPCDPSLQPQ